jgi:hypothetical protein
VRRVKTPKLLESFDVHVQVLKRARSLTCVVFPYKTAIAVKVVVGF